MTIDDDTDCAIRLLAFYTPEEAAQWMTMSHPQLGGRRATDCTKDEVMAIIDRLESCAYI